MKNKAGILLLCLALTQCSEGIDLMDRPLHKNNNSFQNEEHRLLPMDGAHNTRELGGYKTTDGKSVKWGMLFRSDKLSDISEADQKYFKPLALKRLLISDRKKRKLKIQTLFQRELAMLKCQLVLMGQCDQKLKQY